MINIFAINWVQLPTAQQIADKMQVGFNMVNTLEAICGKNAWGASMYY